MRREQNETVGLIHRLPTDSSELFETLLRDAYKTRKKGNCAMRAALKIECKIIQFTDDIEIKRRSGEKCGGRGADFK